MNKHVGNIIDIAYQSGRESDLMVEKYCKWEDYILPLIEEKFGIKNFPLNLRNSAKKEIQEFINEKELEYGK
jgi:hypothetical protein